jgi:hypothetical protein
MSKGLKKNYPMYAKMDNVLVEGIVELSRLTPKTFNTFIKSKHGEDANINDYIIFEALKINVKEA